MRTTLKLIAILACLALVLAGCGAGGDAEAVDLNSYTLDEIIAKAQEEGDVQSVGMPGRALQMNMVLPIPMLT